MELGEAMVPEVALVVAPKMKSEEGLVVGLEVELRMKSGEGLVEELEVAQAMELGVAMVPVVVLEVALRTMEVGPRTMEVAPRTTRGEELVVELGVGPRMKSVAGQVAQLAHNSTAPRRSEPRWALLAEARQQRMNESERRWALLVAGLVRHE